MASAPAEMSSSVEVAVNTQEAWTSEARLSQRSMEAMRCAGLDSIPEPTTDIMHGVELSRTLSNFGMLWRKSPIDYPPCKRERLWGMSRKTDRLDIFLSHSWSTPGWVKVLMLAMHFYWSAAAVAGVLTVALFFALDCLGFMPTWRMEENLFTLLDLDVSPWCLIPPVVILAVLLVAPSLPKAGKDPLVFFDALCINQVDESMTIRGIYSLGEFLRNSSSLVIMWTPEYLTRLWCMYELAIFTAHHKSDGDRRRAPIMWSRLFEYKLLAALFVTSWFYLVGVSVSFYLEEIQNTLVFVDLLLGLLLFYAIRPYARSRATLKAQFERFDIDDAQCREPLDREYIKDTVRRVHGSEEAFNKYVQGPLYDQTISETQMFSYRCMLAVSIGWVCISLEFVAAYVRSGMPSEELLSITLFEAVEIFAFTPWLLKMFISLFMWVSTRFRGKWTDRLAPLALVPLSLACYYALLAFVMHPLKKQSRRPEASLAWLAMNIVALAAFFRPAWLCRLCRCRRVPSAD